MDISRTKHLAGPAVRARYAPVFWEPLPGSGERICAIVLLAPEIDSVSLLAPAAHVVINNRRLRAMCGAERGDSVIGILAQAAEFMKRRLFAGADLTESLPPFEGFSVGPVRKVKGFTAEQVIDAAVSLVSAFGSAEDLLDETGATNNNATVTTREFLARVQTAFAPADDPWRKRFLRPVETQAGRITIDYVHDAHLVQFASAPTTERQAQNMVLEAEAKILQTMTVQKTVLEGRAKMQLVINTMPLHVGGLPDATVRLAHATMAHYVKMAGLYDVQTAEASTHEEAVRVLADLG
jgi:hypothetical protein